MARALRVEILGDEQSVLRSFKNASRGAKNFENSLGRSARGAIAASVSFRGLGRSLSFASAQFLGGAGIVYALKSVISETSRVQEETEKTSVVFGRNAAQVQTWSKTLAQSFGVSDAAALEATGRFGNMLRPLGFATDSAAKMSERLVELAADMASFNNAKPGDVLQALSSGLAGQVRPLRQYGVFLSQDRIKQEALNDGIVKNASHLTQAQKVQAAYNIILKDTVNAQGDVQRNTGSLSVAMSKLTAGIQDTEAGLGSALLPTVTAYVNQAAKWLNNTENQQRLQHDFKEAIHATTTVLRDAKGVIHGVDEATGGLKHTIELLIGLKVVSTLHSWTKALAMFEIAAGVSGGGGAAKSATTLGAKLREIAQMGVISTAFKFPKLAESLSKIAILRGSLGKLALFRGIVIPITIAMTADFVGKKLDVNTDFSPGKLAGDLGDLFHGKVAKGPLLNAILGNGWKSDTGNNTGNGKKGSTTKVDTSLSARGPSGPVLTHIGDRVAPLDRGSQISNAVQQARTDLARGDKGAKTRLIAALKQQIDFDNKYATIQGRLAAKGGKNAKKHADTMRQLLADEASAYDEISSFQKKDENAAARAAAKRLAALKKADRIFLKGFQIRLANAKGGGANAQLAVLRDERAALEKRLKVEKGNQGLQQALADTQNKISAIVAKQKQAMKDALDSAKSVVGDLGQGPVATGPFAQTLESFGARPDAKMFTQDLAAQNKQGAAFMANLNRLKKRGAPTDLIQSLLGQGQGGMDEASALAGASKGQFKAFLGNYKQRQKLLTQVAQMEVHAPVVHVTAQKVTVGKTDAHDRRGDKFASSASRRPR